MSVIVKGIEMPQDCNSCIVSYGYSWVLCRAAGRFWGIDKGQQKRPDWCPLHPLPEKHGRLIDADEATRGSLERTGKRLLAIDTAPTIVEAEGDD